MDIVSVRRELLSGKSIYDLNLRVVNYDRVSTDKEEQINSLRNQGNYFKDMIASIPSWHHVGSYEDEGISGTSALKRESFLKMIEDAKEGSFDMIVTKEISRFARNTMDSIFYTQLLLNYGVVVFFLSDNINTIYPDSEFRLTLMASMAQDEVRKLSERVKFGIQRSVRDHKVGGSSLYGYYKEKGRMRIVLVEAEVVRRIFILYATGKYSFLQVRTILDHEGCFTRNGNSFSDTTLRKMILNPRYKGWYTANMSEVVDYKSHKRVYKRREDWILFKDTSGNIPSIVSDRLWEKANQVYLFRKSHKSSLKVRSPFSFKIYCPKNHLYLRCASGARELHPVWQCSYYVEHGKRGCCSPILSEEKLLSCFQDYFLNLFSKIDSFFQEVALSYQKLGVRWEDIAFFLEENYSILSHLSTYISLFVSRIVVLSKRKVQVFFHFGLETLFFNL